MIEGHKSCPSARESSSISQTNGSSKCRNNARSSKTDGIVECSKGIAKCVDQTSAIVDVEIGGIVSKSAIAIGVGIAVGE